MASLRAELDELWEMVRNFMVSREGIERKGGREGQSRIPLPLAPRVLLPAAGDEK